MKRFLLLFAFLFSISIGTFAQTHTVTGKVIDEQGDGIEGANVMLKGLSIFTVSDVNGDWLLEVPDEGRLIFVVNALGFTSFTTEDSSQFILVSLKKSTKEHEGEVVTAFDTRRDKRGVGFNTATVDGETLNAGSNTSAVGALAGKINGANITNYTGGLGGSTRIVFRGEKSFIMDNNALIVVDGVIMNNFERTSVAQGISKATSQTDFGNSINDINPDDIESVTVLEGSVAAGLYGNAGANGAVMITTKKRNSGVGGDKLEVSYKMGYELSSVLKLPDVQHQYGQGNVYANNSDYRSTNSSWGTTFDNAVRPWGQIINGKELVKPYSDQPDNLSSFFDMGKALTNYVSVAGGNDSNSFFLSINAVNGTNVIPNDFTNKYSVRFNGQTQLANHFYASINANYFNSYSRAEWEGQGGPTGMGGVMTNLLNTPRDIPVWELKDLNSLYNSMEYTDQNGVLRYGFYNSKYMNPYWTSTYFDNRNNSNRILGAAKIGYQDAEFNVYDRVGADINADMNSYKTPLYNVSAADQTGIYPGTGYVGTNFTSLGGYATSAVNGLRVYNDFVANLTHAFDQNFGLSVTLGNSISIKRDLIVNTIIDPVTSGLILPNYYNFTNNLGAVTATNTLIEQRTIGTFADVKFHYQRELFAELTGRLDYSSTYDYQSPHLFPGGNLAWVFTERMHDWLKNNVLNYGKIRFGASGAGHDALAYANNNAGYLQSPIASANGAVIPTFNGMPVYSIQNIFGPSNLRPELTREFEIGTDLSFLKDRLSFSYTYYNAYTTNVIAAVPVAGSTGFQYNYRNIGEVSNIGTEMLLRGTPIATRYGLVWDLFVAYSRNKNNVESLNDNNLGYVSLGGAYGIQEVAAVGHPLGTFYGSDIQYYQNPKDGSWHPVVDSRTGLPIAAAPTYHGSYQPDYILSWGTDVKWQGLRLHALFTSKQGGVYYSYTKELMDVNGTSQETTVNSRKPLAWENSVTQVGVSGQYVTNTTKYLPYNYYVNEIGSNNLPAQNLVSATYVKLQELSLSYSVPRRYYARSPFGSLEAGIYGNNLIIWTPESNHYDDPETATSGAIGNAQGLNYVSRPSVRNYGMFIKVTF
jgi:TonB-linked SusC/RagA family outer membrane protein